MPRRSTWNGRDAGGEAGAGVGSGVVGTCESLGGPGGLSETAKGMKSVGFDHSEVVRPYSECSYPATKLECPRNQCSGLISGGGTGGGGVTTAIRRTSPRP